MCGRTACTLAPPEVRQACSRKAPRAVKKEPEGSDETGEDVGGKEAHDGKDVFEMPEWRDHPGGSKFEYRPKFNTGPSTFVPIMVSGIHFGLDPGTRVIQPMHWGLVPPWHKNENFRSHGLTTINCRHETLLQKQLFSKPLKQNKRGVLICDGFYEWRRKDGSKQPYYFFFHQPDKEILPGDPAWRKHVEKIWDPQTGWHGPRPLTVAVVFDLWHPPKEDADHPEIRSFSVITVPASKTVEFVHDRMPAILDGDEAIDKWLDPNVKVEDALKSLRGHSGLAFHKVSTHCNNVHNDSVVCVRPLTDSTMKIGNQATIMNFFKKRTTTEIESGSVKRSMEEEGTVKEETSSGKKAKTE